MSPLSVHLRALREQRGLTQAALAELVGVRQATISDLENEKSGRIEFDLLGRLAAALGTTPAALLDGRTAVEEWMRAHFPDAEVASGYHFSRDLYLFRASWHKKTPIELEVTQAALDDFPAPELVVALDRANVAQRLADQPGTRLLLDKQLRVTATNRHSSKAPGSGA